AGRGPGAGDAVARLAAWARGKLGVGDVDCGLFRSMPRCGGQTGPCHLRLEDRIRKIVALENVTLDGFADSQEGLGFEWTAGAYDDEVDRYSNEHVRADVDTA